MMAVSRHSTSLQDKLKAKGYDVWMVAPARIKAVLAHDYLQTGKNL